jgi:ATP-dependent RNA helicase SUPV3L1/SUV3
MNSIDKDLPVARDSPVARDLPVARGGPRLTAVLGPTNTGKTHLAVERMLGHASGMIGLPLRLLAREIYDRIVAQLGPGVVALITGEEKIVPAHPRFFVCTVEAMPLERRVAFMAIDEIQLCADPERGHVFTDRLLRARGDEETMFLGADTMRPLIRQLLPEVQFISRPRFSDLTYTGPKKLSRLPRRSAIVAFSSDAVYGLAELMRSQRGGAAVVMGALSPRTRNAQVALYQSGEVDFLVASDAIGMGLNMDVDHVAFASLSKFDGVSVRPLRATEIAQIAGRAGRHMNDGTFGPTGEVPPFEGGLVEQVEQHRFDPIRVLQWRNPQLDFQGLEHLIRSLEMAPPAKGLARARLADYLAALKSLAGQPAIADLARGEGNIRTLWNVCQVPDFRKATIDEHARLLAQIFEHLIRNDNRLPTDWIAGQVERIAVTGGDIDTLSARLAQIRVWTYVSHRAGWLEDAAHWQDKTRDVEDALSDALHEALTQRFIDRRTSLLMRRLAEDEDLNVVVDAEGEVQVEGEYVGRLNGFVFEADWRGQASALSGSLGSRTLRQAAARALGPEIAQRAQRLASAQGTALQLSEHGKIWWEGAPVARLTAGPTVLSPKVELIADDLLQPASRERVQARLELWLREHIVHVLAPLAQLAAASDLEGLARGLAFQLVEQLGNIPRAEVSDTVRALDQQARAALRRYGVRFGAHSVFLPALLKPAAAGLKVLLWSVRARAEDAALRLPPMPAPGLVSVPIEAGAPPAFYERAGFRPCGLRAVRIDMLERLSDMLRPPKPVAAITPIPQAQTAPSSETSEAPAEAEPAPVAVVDEPADAPHESPEEPAGDARPAEPSAEAPPLPSEPPPATDAAVAAAPAPAKGAVAADGSFTVSAEMMSIVGMSGPEFEALLRSLGFRARQGEEGKLVWRMGRRRDPAEIRARPKRDERSSSERKSGPRPERRPHDANAAPRDEAQRGEEPKGERPAGRQEWRRHPKQGQSERPPREGRGPGEGRGPNERKGPRQDKNFREDKGLREGQGPRDGNRSRPHKPAEKPLDPNSPFAKLAILKEAMTKGR